MGYGELIPNLIVLGLLALVVAKVNEAVVGRVYDAAYALFGVDEETQGKINSTRFIWAVGLGVLICVCGRIPFLASEIPSPLAEVMAGIIVGSGAGVIWDIALDPTPQWPQERG